MKICGKGLRIDGRVIRIGRLEADRFEFLDDPEAALEEIRNSGVRMDLFSFVQKLRDRQPRYSYPMEWDNLAALPVSTFDHWWTKQIDSKTRNMVRRAEKKGVTVREVLFDDMLVRGISEVYNESPIRQGKPFWHYQKSLDAVRRANETFVDRSTFITASLGDEVIGFAKLVPDEDHQQASLMQILSMVSHRDKSPTNALIAQAVRSCAERGIPYLVYANFAYDNKLRDSLSDFKQTQRVPADRCAQVLRAAHDERPDCTAPGSASSDNDPHSRAGARTTAGYPRLVVRAQHPRRESRRRTVERRVNA